MAKILYGIHGTGHGHAMRGLTIARALPQHEFLFVANDDAPAVLEPEFHVARLPNLGTVFRDYRVDLPGTIKKAIPILRNSTVITKQALKLIDDFKPDVCMADLERFVPLAAKKAGLPCLSLDHQHVITCCRHKLPANMLWDTFLQGLTPRWLFPPTDPTLIVSFYAPPVRGGMGARVVPPILRRKVIDAKPHDAGHILVYQSNSTDRRLIDFLRKATNRRAYIYGYQDKEAEEGNLVFKKRDEDEFVRLLAGCSYVIQGGSHTLMSEALYLGKPILSLPLLAMVEQRFNALYLERLGYGRQTTMAGLNAGLLRDFEDDLLQFAARIGVGNFLGNDLVFGLVDKFAATGQIDG